MLSKRRPRQEPPPAVDRPLPLLVRCPKLFLPRAAARVVAGVPLCLAGVLAGALAGALAGVLVMPG